MGFRTGLMEIGSPYSLEPVVLLNEVFPGHTNALNTLYGGRLMSIMDTAAGMSASKFAHREFVTVSVDALKFRRPAFQGDVIRTTARVVWTSPRTAGVHVISCRLSRSEWEGEEICSGFYFMVAIDESMKPVQIPQFTPETDEEKALWEMADTAREAMR
ncbi:MAG: hotdog domain-containing protein [Candidatus Thermoplasmatota archaeon]|jgi:acyl-CoA hydrolase|uniref:HotDog ACOT-type domain-containing protein n=1 Tax=marine metagenome TaxID=408172 RepID=A0A381PYC3_9ZZZZ|nr:hotdog domain-containing protein [Candidatus Thermoplasmatota archaeon]|tara:strand:- start:205 stop:681 length:477 start_codon:yes stop_codon:yes gene_type:complete